MMNINFSTLMLIKKAKLVRFLYYPIYVYLNKNLKFEIYEPIQTANMLANSTKSFARLGDGEINIIKGKSIRFQKYSDQLRQEILETINNNEIEIGLPHGFKYTNIDKFSIKVFWWSYLVRHFVMIQKHFQRKEYFDTNFSRVVSELQDYQYIEECIDEVKQIWADKRIIVVEGAATRFGVGNDLFDHTISVKRILAPAKHAYMRINELEKSVYENAKSDDVLVLIALGPSATVLVNRLSKKGIRAIDVGHFDLQYEHFLAGKRTLTKIAHKFNNEVTGGENISDIHDEKYLREIVADIK